jgi:hypothetical protein
MSLLANDTAGTEGESMADALPFPRSSGDTNMGSRLAALRDTILVAGVQIVFRATLFLRRWNY